MKPKSKVLIIAGSDSSGGAGIQADIKTVTSLGSYAMTAITAVTSQNTTGVKSIVPIKPKEISSQINFYVIGYNFKKNLMCGVDFFGLCILAPKFDVKVISDKAVINPPLEIS